MKISYNLSLKMNSLTKNSTKKLRIVKYGGTSILKSINKWFAKISQITNLIIFANEYFKFIKFIYQ